MQIRWISHPAADAKAPALARERSARLSALSLRDDNYPCAPVMVVGGPWNSARSASANCTCSGSPDT